MNLLYFRFLSFALLIIRSETSCLAKTSVELKAFCNIKVECSFHDSQWFNNYQQNLIINCCRYPFVKYFLNLKFWKGTLPQQNITINNAVEINPSCIRKVDAFHTTVFGLSGLDQNFRLGNVENIVSHVYLSQTHFKLIGKLVDINGCPQSEFEPVFKISSKLVFKLKEGCIFSLNTCDLIFYNANIYLLAIEYIENSLIRQNLFGIFKSANWSSKALNSNIRELEVIAYAIDFNDHLFDGRVFTQTKEVTISGLIKKFDSKVFVESMIETIKLKLMKLRQFLHQNIEWLDLCDTRLAEPFLLLVFESAKPPLNVSSREEEYVKMRETYQYEYLYQIDSEAVRENNIFREEDFCLYFHYYNKSLEISMAGYFLERQGEMSCSCTFLFILEKFYIYSRTEYYYRDPWIKCDREHMINKCNFERLGLKCEFNLMEPEIQFAFYDMVLSFKYLEYWLSVYFRPVISFFGMLVNVIIIVAFRSAKKSPEYRRNKLTDKNRRMWDYIYINSCFQMVQAGIFMLSPITACIAFQGIYCSSLASVHLGQLFYLVVESFFENSFRLTANITNTFYVLYRYAINLECWPKLRNAKVKRVAYSAFGFSLALSIIKLLVNERFNVLIINEDSFDYLNHVNLDLLNQNIYLRVLYFLNMILGNILFTILNISIDLRLLCSFRRRRNEQTKEKAEKRITHMIVLNGFFSLFFKLPELLLSVFWIAFTINPRFFPMCSLLKQPNASACPTLFQITKFFYAFSFFENFLLLYFYNPYFKKILGLKQKESNEKNQTTQDS
nr:G protein-coupled receptor [Proales similis]